MDTYTKELETSLRGIVQHFHDELQGVRSNRPNPQLIENVVVSAYDQTLTVKEVGSISIVPPRTMEVNVWDKSIITTVAKALEDAKSGLSVSNDGSSIRVTLPALTDERRAEFAKLAKKIAESARISVRNHRDDIMKKVKAAEERKELSEDVVFKGKERLQKVVDEANAKVEGELHAKLAEIAE
jgi:ribosome recycling factor